MQVTSAPRQSPAASARRAQIVDATVVTLAELGYQRASFVEIARRAQLSSTRLISYHFDSRAELMAQVAGHVITGLGSAVGSSVRAAESPAAAMRAYIEANLAYMDTHRAQMAALTALLFSGALEVPAEQANAGVEALTAIFEAARGVGQLRDVDPAIAATVVQRAVEAVPILLRDRPDADLVRHARELVDFFETALLRSGTASRTS